MVHTPESSSRLACSQERAAGQRESAGSATNAETARAATAGLGLVSGPARLRSGPSILGQQAGSSSCRALTSSTEAPPADQSAGRPVEPTSTTLVASAVPPPEMEEEELLEADDEVMVDAGVRPSAAVKPASDARTAAPRENAAAATPVSTLADATEAVGKRKKKSRGGRRHRRRKAGQADIGQRVEPTAPRAAMSSPARGSTLAVQRGRDRSSRPAHAESRLPAWDKLPARQRRIFSNQERAAFRKDGVLVSQFDIPLYYAVSRFDAGSLYQIFPRAPKWWPGNWGELPVMLPWEVCLHRSRLVAADEEDPLWKSVYQKFLEQLAKGWDPFFQKTSDRSQIAALPKELAYAMIQGGAFAFAMGPPSLLSFQSFLERHEWMGLLPDQRVSQAEVWDRLGVDLAAEQTAPSSKGSRACRCSQKLARASTRVGLESKLLEAASDLKVQEMTEDSEKLTVIAATALQYSLNPGRASRFACNSAARTP